VRRLSASILLLLAVTLFAPGCGGLGTGDGAQVVAGFYPLAFAAREIAGRRTAVRDLTPPGAEPHDLEVTPKVVELVRGAKLTLLLGRNFQPQLEKAAGHGGTVLRLLDTPGLKVLPDDDPHVWLDPHRYALVASRIGRALGRPAGARRFARRLDALDRTYRRGLARCARRVLVTSHRAFAYLAQRYGLRQFGVTGLSPEAEPSPRDLERVVRAVRRNHATTVFFENLASPRIAKSVARETGAASARLDPIEGLTPAAKRRGDDYFSLMRSNLARIRKALDCR
jgi:zinc transport system substrate-binding protein